MYFDFDAIAPANRYKLLVSTVVPRPIAWVVTLDLEGRLNAAPYSFFNAVSQDPAVVCIGIGGRAPGDAKDTGNNIRRTGEFVVNLVAAANAEQMNITAIEFAHDVDELRQAGLTTLPSQRIKPPRIAESPVGMECERLATIDLGNQRTLVLGRVLAMHIRDDAVLDREKCYIDTPRLDLIGRMHGRGWYTRTTDRFEMGRIALEEFEQK